MEMALHGINSKVVSRVLETALEISVLEQKEKKFKGRETKDTFDNFEDAIKLLPAYMDGATTAYTYNITPTWEKAYCPDKFNRDM